MNRGTMTSPVFQNQTGDVFYENLGLNAAFDYYSKRNLDMQDIIQSAELLYSLWSKRNVKWYHFAQGFRDGAYMIAKIHT
jgi:hypothetical protein